MSEPNGSAASLLAGNPEPNPAGSGDSGSGNPPPAPASTATTWLEGVADPETLAWAGKKGWKTPGDALASHRELEKMLGGEKVPVPKDPNDKAAWDLFFKAAGRPESPDGYELSKVEGIDPEIAKEAAAAFHGAGMTPAQVKAALDLHGKQIAAQASAADNAFMQQSAADQADLRKEWGANFDSRLEAGRRAAAAFGFDGDTIAKLDRAIGTKALLTKFADIGAKLTEAPMRGNGAETDSQFLTKEGANARITALKKDPEWAARWMNGGAREREELSRLQKIAVS